MISFGKNNKNIDAKFSLEEYLGIINMISKNHDSTIAQILNAKGEVISMTYIDSIEYCNEDNVVHLKRLINNKFEVITAILDENASNIKYKSEISESYNILTVNIPCNAIVKRDKNNEATLNNLDINNYIKKMNQLSKVHDLNMVRLFNKKGQLISITEINGLEYIVNSKLIEFKRNINKINETIGVINNLFIKDIEYKSTLNKNKLCLTIDIIC